MGLLDDAIREHLELKKKHGADLAEVERQEREALGAARQAEFAPADEDQSGSHEPGDEEPLSEAAEPVDAGDEREPFDVDSLEPIEDDAQVREPGETASGPGYDKDPWLEDERDEVPAGEALDHPREPGEEKGEDVLEDTPDFLQETPEHDRLWFEQKPPRDFDWDK
jgi:hypothetical protein